MLTSLTDQMFGAEKKSLTDQLFAEKPKDLTDQMFKTETAPAPAPVTEAPTVKSITEELRSEELSNIPSRVFKELYGLDQATFESLKAEPIISEQFKQGVAESLRGYAELAKNPYEIVRGATEFVTALPGFALGIVGAGQRMLERMIAPFDLEDLYDAASSGMSDIMQYWSEKVTEPLLGKPTRASQMVGATAMAPALVIAQIGQELASWKRFEDSPNLRGLLKFGGDIGGLIALGRLYRGSGSEVTAEVENVVRKAAEHKIKQDATDQIPNDIIKSAQQKILDMEKNQLELRSKELMNKLSYDEAIREELSRKAEEVARIKQLKPESTTPWWLDDARKEAIRIKRKAKKGEVVPEEVKVKEPVEPLTDLDLQTGTRDPIELSTENSPFRETDTEATAAMRKIYAENKNVAGSPDLIIGKTINDVNSYLDGVEGIDINKIRNGISDFAVAAKDPANRMALLDYFEGNSGAVDNFVEMASEVASWARRAERGKKGGGDIQLNMMIPVDKIPEMVKDAIKEMKGLSSIAKIFGELWGEKGTGKFKDAVRIEDLYRNRKIFNKTGFWLGRDGMWRYEVDSSQARYHPSSNILNAYNLDISPIGKLGEMLDYPHLYSAVPGLRSTIVKFDKTLEVDGRYDPNTNMIILRKPGDKVTLFHEIQHKVNDLLGSRFRGTTLQSAEAAEKLGYLADRMTKALPDIRDYETRDFIRSLIKLFKEESLRDDPNMAILPWFYEDAIPLIKAKEGLHFANELSFPIRPSSMTVFSKYRRSPGEMEARVTEARMNMSAKERAKNPPWETLDEMLIVEGTVDITKSGFIDKPGTKLYSGLPLNEAAKQIIAGARKVAAYTSKARGMKAFKPMDAARALKEEFNRSFIDRSGNIRNELLDKLGNDGYEVIQKMYLSKGASSVAANNLKQMQKEVYSGLSKNEKRILDNLILADRMIDIGGYKTKFKFPEEIEPKNSIAYKEAFEYTEKLSPEQAETLRQRAGAYFEWMKKPLKDMLDSELISEQEFNDLSSHNYRRLKLVDIYDKRYQSKIGKKKRTVYDSGIEALSKGRDTDIFEPSSEIMALEVFNRAYGRILNNEANKALLDIARKDPENPFVRVKEAKGDKIPSGWNRIFLYEKGERKSIYLSPEMSKEWITNNPEMSYRMSQLIRFASGSAVLRTFATGINWGFAVANLPRDVMHTWFAARTFQDGEWSSIYSPHAPIFGLQIGRDLATVFIDAVLKKGRYQDYINEGGGMEFLVHQGRLLQRGRHIEGTLDKIQNFFGYFGETSEVMTRLAIRDRVIRKRAKEQGVSFEEARKNKDITREATFAARDYMDFGQGGGIAKALDNGIPYLSAAIQGTRGLFRSFKPGSGTALSSTYKLSQFAAVVTGLYIASQKMCPESSKALKGNIDNQNNLCIPLGDGFGFLDNEGQMRYVYIKIPLDPSQKFFKAFFEASTDKWLGNEVDVDNLVDTLKQFSPVGTASDILPPTASGAIGYSTNKDFWLNEDIWKKTEPFSFPKSGEEYTKDTPQAFIDLGAKTGLSPERTKYLVEELTTSGTLWSYLLGQGYDAAFGDLPKEKKEQHLAMILSKTPVFKRFIGATNPYSKYAKKIDQAQEDVVLKDFVQNRNFDILVDGYLYGEGVNRQDIIKEATKYSDKEVYDRLIDRLKFEEAIRELPEKSFWRRMKGLRMEAKAKIFADRLQSSNQKEEDQLWREYALVSRAKGIISPEFREEVRRQMIK
uniref:Uncharacterized protein n=1 Tax=viral metagenome TaxID=1070528 RepID=A0A6M3JBS2_9ZZZZ